MTTNTAPDTHPGRPPYPAGVTGDKFNPDGSVRRFPGNTIIFHLPTDSPLQAPLRALYDKLDSAAHLKHLYTLLPPDSWHMTVFEGVCDQVRQPGYWPNDLPMDAPLEKCTAIFSEKLAGFEPAWKGQYAMRVIGMEGLEIGIGISLAPDGDEMGSKVSQLRDSLAKLLSIRHPVHDKYGLHLSVAYFVQWPTEDQLEQVRDIVEAAVAEMQRVDHGRFILSRAEFCVFEDMFKFQRRFYIGETL